MPHPPRSNKNVTPPLRWGALSPLGVALQLAPPKFSPSIFSRPVGAQHTEYNKMLSCRRETALQGTLVLAESGRLELGDNILRTL